MLALAACGGGQSPPDPLADLTVTVDVNDPMTSTAPLEYSIVLSNAGPDDGEDIVVTHFLSNSFLESLDAPGVACNASSSRVDCSLPLLVSGEPKQIRLNSRAPAEGGVVATVTEISGSSLDPDPFNNSVSVERTVVAEAALSIFVTDTPDPVAVGQPLAYNLAISSSGPSSGRDGVLVITPMGGVTIESVDGFPWTCTGSPEVTCTAPEVPFGTTSVVVRAVAPASAGTVGVRATLSSAAFDPDPSNNEDLETTSVTP